MLWQILGYVLCVTGYDGPRGKTPTASRAMNSCAAEALSRKLLSSLTGGRTKKAGVVGFRAFRFEELDSQIGIRQFRLGTWDQLNLRRLWCRLSGALKARGVTNVYFCRAPYSALKDKLKLMERIERPPNALCVFARLRCIEALPCRYHRCYISPIVMAV